MILRDSTDPDLIPPDSDAVAGYGDGLYLWTSAGWDRFPPATPRLVIVVRPGDRGDVGDVERLDFAPADAPGFVRDFDRPARRAPSLYVNRVNWPAVVAALEAAGLDPTAIDWWIATLDGTTDVWYGSPGVAPPAGLRVVAVQVRDVGAYDESVVLDPEWPGGVMTQDQFNALMDGWLGQQGMSLTDLNALRWRVETILSNAPQVSSGPTAGEINVLAKALAPPTGASAAQLAAALRAAAHQLDGQ